MRLRKSMLELGLAVGVLGCGAAMANTSNEVYCPTTNYSSAYNNCFDHDSNPKKEANGLMGALIVGAAITGGIMLVADALG